MRARCFVFALLAACGNPSQLDHLFDHGGHPGTAPADPWSGTFSSQPDHDDGNGKGFDLPGMLSKLKESIEKPGPYEAPEKSAELDPTKPHLGVLRLSGEVVEREAFSLTGSRGTELRKLIDRFHELAHDPLITGLVLRVGSISISMPDAVELRAAMHAFRDSKKTLACHVENASNVSYLLLAACDRIGLAPLGEIAITGPAAMPIHIKGLLDKLGIEADFIHVGAYKGAAEPLTREAPSKEMEETLGAILDRRYDTMIDVIATDRKLEPAAVKALIDTGLFPADQAKEARLVDDIAPFEQFRDAGTQPWVKITLTADHDDLGAYMKLARFIGAMPPERPIVPHVAVVYALGNIVDGSGDGVLGARQEIAANTLVAALDAIAKDVMVKAVVLRIDSGGGSAQASELIWRAVADLHMKKPVYVSMSDVAASGGYYIASGADKIFALDNTLTGSIGVVGGHVAPAGALAKIGVTTFPMGRGKRATMMASLAPWKPEDKAVIETSMKAVYDTFVGRVASGRHKKPDEIQPIAQGRVWVGAKAKELGLVDEIGGLEAAVSAVEALVKVEPSVDLEIYPPAPTLRDLIQGWGGTETAVRMQALGELAANLDPELARAAERLVSLVLTFRTTHVQTLAILPELP